MRLLIAFGLLMAGVYLAIHGWLPAQIQIPLPVLISSWAVPMGLIMIFLGLLTARRRARKPAFGDGPLVSTLTQAGFRVAPIPNGWQGVGTWKGVPLNVRKSIGHDAGRFGRPWTIVVALPGHPAEPWPFLPEEGLIIERRADGFSVAMADLSRPERMHRLGERLDQLLGQRN